MVLQPQAVVLRQGHRLDIPVEPAGPAIYDADFLGRHAHHLQGIHQGSHLRITSQHHQRNADQHFGDPVRNRQRTDTQALHMRYPGSLHQRGSRIHIGGARPERQAQPDVCPALLQGHGRATAEKTPGEVVGGHVEVVGAHARGRERAGPHPVAVSIEQRLGPTDMLGGEHHRPVDPRHGLEREEQDGRCHRHEQQGSGEAAEQDRAHAPRTVSPGSPA